MDTFESGAPSKSIRKARVSPIIFGLLPSDLTRSPLLQFQLTQFNVEDIRKLVSSINNSAVDTERISAEMLNRSFSRAWEELKTFVEAIDLTPAVVHSVIMPTSSSAAFPKPMEDAIQEILTNSRSELKLLNSPQSVIPPAYLLDIIREARIVSPPVPDDHPAWRDLERNIATISAIVADGKSDHEFNLVASDNSDRTERVMDLSKIGDLIRQARDAVEFLKRKIYSSEKNTRGLRDRLRQSE